MPRLLTSDPFNPDQYSRPVVGIAARIGLEHDAGLHSHHKHQLLFSQQGSMSIRLNHQFCLLPPGRAAWLPSEIKHHVKQRGTVEYRSIYIAPNFSTLLPSQPQILTLTPLFSALIERIALAPFEENWTEGVALHLLRVFIDELVAAPTEPMMLTLPDDPRLIVLQPYLDEPGCIPSLAELATQSPASAKTITRIFQKQTGMSYQQWRQLWRLMRSIELLSEGNSMSVIASELEFASDSAFIAFFRQYLGTTPKRYIQPVPPVSSSQD